MEAKLVSPRGKVISSSMFWRTSMSESNWTMRLNCVSLKKYNLDQVSRKRLSWTRFGLEAGNKFSIWRVGMFASWRAWRDWWSNLSV